MTSVPPRLDDKHFIFLGIEHLVSEPTYSVAEVGKFFFARPASWVRHLERSGRFTLDGKPIEITRTENGRRSYTLPDVEKMAHALAQQGMLSGEQLLNVLLQIQQSAKVWGYL
jgi:hypothetical protein